MKQTNDILEDNQVLYNNGEIELKVSVDNDTIWLSQKQLSALFEVTKQNVSLHINRIFKDEELKEELVVKYYLTTAKDGKKYKTKHYNLDMIISIGYRVNSIKATKFRQWATSVLKSYIQYGYVINSEKITNERFVSLENDVNFLKEKVNNISNQIEDKSIELKQGIFYDGEIFDAYSFISDLIRSAKSEIILIDNYVDDTTLNLFSKNQNATVTIYTHSISRSLKTDLEKYNKQYKKIDIKTNKSFHDRFLIIDDKEIYHIGASLKDLGKKTFAFSKMDIGFLNILDKLK